MSKQRYIQDSFWTDPYVEELSMPEKLVFLYLLTNPLCNVAGIYEITERRLSLETGAEKKEIKKILEKFTKDEKIIRHKSWILIIQFGKHQSTNPNIEIGVRRILEALPDEIKALKGFERIRKALEGLLESKKQRRFFIMGKEMKYVVIFITGFALGIVYSLCLWHWIILQGAQS